MKKDSKKECATKKQVKKIVKKWKDEDRKEDSRMYEKKKKK